MPLFDAWHNEQMTAEEFDSLQSILRADESIRRTFLEYASHDALLRERVGGLSIASPWADSEGAKEARAPRPVLLILGVVITLIVGFGASYLLRPSESVAEKRLPDHGESVSPSDDSTIRAWKKWSERFRQDADLLAYYTFEKGSVEGKRAANLALFGTADLVISGVGGAPGRFGSPDDSSIEFSARKSCAKVSIEGEFKSLSLLAWVQLDALDRRFNSLFITDGYDPGEVHWMIRENGTILFSFLREEKGNRQNFISLSPVVWDRTKMREWLCLGVALDFEQGLIRHYLDGEEIFSEAIPDTHLDVVTRIGDAEIGNWGNPSSPKNREYAGRNLNGKIDEFAIVGRALSKTEFRQFYRSGTEIGESE